MKIVRYILLAVAWAAAGSLWAQSPAEEFFNDGEEITLTVSYRAKLLPNTEVAKVVLRTTAEQVDGRKAFKIYGNGRVAPSFRWFYNLNDTYHSWLDASTGRPIRFTSEIREGNYRASSRFDYDWEEGRVRTVKQRRSDPPVERLIPLSQGSFDGLALFYNLRRIDASQFRRGEVRMLELLLDDTVRRIRYKFLGREERKIRGVGTFRTLKFTCQMATSTGESFDDGTEFTIWISDDRNKIPIYFESPIKIGSVRAYLASYEGLRYPLESLVE